MIRYALRCACGHAFDAWFTNADAYDDQEARGLVTCPVCDGNAVAKAPMAPAIGKAHRSAPAEHVMMRAALMALSRQLKQQAEAVGERFPEEARRIHRGEAEERPIWGKATGEEAEALRDEGIQVHALPDLPDHDA